jgi:hypothetical protein
MTYEVVVLFPDGIPGLWVNRGLHSQSAKRLYIR